MDTKLRHLLVAALSLSNLLYPATSANTAPNPIEIISITESSNTSVEILFNSNVPKKSLSYYVINAAIDLPLITPQSSKTQNVVAIAPKNIKKVIKTKATGLITAEIKNLNPKAAYNFSVSVKTNKGKMISSALVEYSPLSNLIDAISNLPADWGNPKPIQLPTPAPTTAPVALPAFTLSSSTETRTVNTAATGFTINSTGGAIASFAINTTPPGMSLNTTTGALTGTPTTVAGATAYTVTATNATSSATQTFTLTVTAVVFTAGQTGPGGGIIYFVSSEGFSCGPTLAATCNYLEVAPSGWNTGADPDIRWAVSGQQSNDVTSITNDAVPYNNVLGIGVGYRNSVAIVNEGNDITTAAGLARAYAGGGKNDWYLPSTAELNLLCQWVRGVATSVTTVCSGGFYEQNGTGNLVAAGIKNNYYWSSSEKDANRAWYQDLYYYLNAPQDTFFVKSYAGSVRPVRAF